ncbi:MAG: PspC domain-containing protein [Minisyncoccia bacterium]
MNKVITINLGGTAYQLEEGAYDALREYFDDAKEKLAEDPDREEILSDLEAAIGGKCDAYLSPGKSVVTEADMAAVIAEMGPVDPASNESAASDKTQAHRQEHTYKKLYRIREDEMIFGVCNGLAAYFGIDVTLVRIIFVLLAIFTGGGFCLAYFIMMLVIPEAETPEERAAAWGAAPITAQGLIDQARKSYEQFTNSDEWRGLKRQWREQARDWKQELKRKHDAHRREKWRGYSHYADYARYADNSKYAYRSYRHYSPFWEFMQTIFGILWLIFWAFVIWLLYNHVPAVHQFLDLLWGWLGYVWQAIVNWLAARTH